jgi:hypothetical protein
VAEWFKAPVLKTGVPARVPWVRIPPLPPILLISLNNLAFSTATHNPAYKLFGMTRTALGWSFSCWWPQLFLSPPCCHGAGKLTDAVGLVEKVVPVAQRLLRVLIDRNGDRLDMLEAMAFTRGPLAQFGECVDPWRVVRLLVVPFQLFAMRRKSPLLRYTLPPRR